MPRKFAIFTDADGDPVAILASTIIAVERAQQPDVNDNWKPIEGEVVVTTNETDENDENFTYNIKGHFADVVKEIEACLTD